MSIIRSTYQLDGLITLDNIKQIAVFSDFDSAVLFRAHHPAWEVHIHLVLPRAPQTPPTSATVRRQPPLEPIERGEANKPALRLRQAQASNKRPACVSVASVPDAQKDINISAYLTDGETIYKQAIFTAEQLGLANEHAQTETDGLLYWEQQPTKALRYRVVEEAILTNSNRLA